MFNNLKSFFFGEQTPEGATAQTSDAKENTVTTATIRPLKNGKFRLLINDNEVFNTYTRRRDAVRGANRAGFRLAA